MHHMRADVAGDTIAWGVPLLLFYASVLPESSVSFFQLGSNACCFQLSSTNLSPLFVFLVSVVCTWDALVHVFEWLQNDTAGTGKGDPFLRCQRHLLPCQCSSGGSCGEAADGAGG